MPRAEYDKQGMYFHSLVKQAGWTQSRVTKLLVKHFSASHWNVLAYEQKRAAINMMRRYANKNRDNVLRKLRQSIVATAAKHGHTVVWLHERMEDWGFGDSLRALDMPKLLEVFALVKKSLTKDKQPQKDEQ